MTTQKRAKAAKQVVREYGKTLQVFIDQVDALVTHLGSSEATMPVPQRRREVCAVVWAVMSAAFAASSLSAEENERLAPLLREVLVPYWEKYCSSEAGMEKMLTERAAYYLDDRDPESQVATASSLVRKLLDSIGADQRSKIELSRTLVPLFAHRMLGDTLHINDVKNRFGIQLSVLGALVAAIGLAQAAYDSALRLMRLG
ncbi:MAG TPA: hypothetical protein VMF52_05125 [Steroidobacteraceae bacterium]|nr:hypothetical protein [Steroidobacteraceae bacterium]